MNSPSAEIPTYRFEFQGGISGISHAERTFHGAEGDLKDRISFCFDDLPLAGSLGRQVSTRIADLIDIAVSVSISDRLAPRQRPGDPRPADDRWHRNLHVVIPVRAPQCWRRPDIVECLDQLLNFLTHDHWTVEFTNRLHNNRQSESQTSFLDQPANPAAPVLHSGGLDSLIGLVDRLSVSDVPTVIPVTVTTNARIRVVTEAVIKELGKADSRFASRLQPAHVHISIVGGERARDDREQSHRTRAMLFLATGIASTVLACEDRLYVCENGVGAISLPMTPDHWGPRASKAMHPKTLALFAKLSSLALDQQVSIHNIGLFATKSELTSKLINDRFVNAARMTASCDRASYSSRGKACGKCTSCILRRVALIAGESDSRIDSGVTSYQTDWLDPATTWDHKNTLQLLAMRSQFEELRSALDDNTGFTGLVSAFPDLYDVVDIAPNLGINETEVEDRLMRLYTAYIHEFEAFVARIDRPGWGQKAVISDLTRPTSSMAS